MTRQVTIGLPTSFPARAVVDFLLDANFVEEWLGEGASFEGRVGAEIVVPSSPEAATATVQQVERTRSSFTLRAAWNHRTDDAGLIVRVTTRPGGTSRVRVTETGMLPDQITDRTRFWSQVLHELGNRITLASHNRRYFRQAVVVVHGIGEQRRRSTLRDFVEAVFPDEKGTIRYVKPDYVSPLIGASSVTVPGRWAMNRPTTDVYELYWAHLIRDTTVGQVYSWALRLLLTPRRNLTPHLRPHVYVIRFLLTMAVAAMAVIAVALLIGQGPRAWVTALVTGAAAALAVIPGVVWKIAKLFGSPVQNLVVANILGDAARYFDTSPANVQVRQSIREAGLQLLNDLHNRHRYSRIIVYGHSLGSVIAYDILAYCWTRRSRSHANAKTMRTPRLRAVEELLNPRRGLVAAPTLEMVRESQHAAWNEFTRNGFEWLVTDLVTAGSPLTHARWLLNPDSDASFDQLVNDRSMPTCPPQTGLAPSPKPGHARKTFTFTHLYRANGDKSARSVLVPDHGALFALVRWTNVFFPHTGFVRGDPVGGPLQSTFGKWVADVGLAHPGGGLGGFAHTKYLDTSKGLDHVEMLRAAMDLTLTPDIGYWLARHKKAVDDAS